eukprot:scaffold9784_cov78-Skeletonema_dohrnii-CCMP3373.AAC.3
MDQGKGQMHQLRTDTKTRQPSRLLNRLLCIDFGGEESSSRLSKSFFRINPSPTPTLHHLPPCLSYSTHCSKQTPSFHFEESPIHVSHSLLRRITSPNPARRLPICLPDYRSGPRRAKIVAGIQK